MSKDKVIHPTNMSKGGDVAKPTKSANIDGPTPTLANLTPYNRSGSNKKK